MTDDLQLSNFDSITQYLLTLKPQSICDAGFGKLQWLDWCIKHNLSFEGIEIDDQLVGEGRKRYPDYAAKLHQGDLSEGLPFADNSYDIVLLIEVIEHIQTPEKVINVLKECVRVAKRKVVITTPNCGDEQMLRENGLIYIHYTHTASAGMKFTIDRAHRHWLRFTKNNLCELLVANFAHFEVVEKKPIKILKPVIYDKLWAEIDAAKEKGLV